MLYMLLIILLAPQTTHAQNWGKLGNGLRPSARTIYADSVLDRLIVGGSFRRVVNGADSVDVMGIAAWDGQRWDSLAARIQTIEFDWQEWVGPVFRFMRYQGQLYANGYISMLLPDSTYLRVTGRLNETTMQWEPLACDFMGSISLMTSIVDDTLYFTGGMTQFCDTFPETCVVQFDGSNFHPFEPFYSLPYHSNNIANLMFRYGQHLYMGGLITLDTNPLDYYDILRFDGTNWEPMPGFTNQGNITSVIEHEGKLYVAGYFRKYQGAPGNSIAVFDGTSWDDLGGGMLMDLDNPEYLYPTVDGIAFHNGELIAVGQFNFAGDTPARNIAKWTGDRWCSYGGHFEQPISGLAFWHDTLYVTGGFATIDGEQYGYVARWDGGDHVESCSTPVGLEHNQWAPSFTLHPNPTTGLLHVEMNGLRPRELFVSDALGRAVLRRALPNTPQGPLQLDLAALSPGAYLVTLLDAQGMRHVQRVVRE